MPNSPSSNPFSPKPTALEIRAAVKTIGKISISNQGDFKWQAWLDTSRWALGEAKALDDKAAADLAKAEADLRTLATARAAAAIRVRFDSSIVDQLKFADLRNEVANVAREIWRTSPDTSMANAIVKALSNYELKKV